MARRSAPLLVSSKAESQLAVSSVDNKQAQNSRSAAAVYDVADTTLRSRRAGVPARRDCQPNSKKLTKPEENVVLRAALARSASTGRATLSSVQIGLRHVLMERTIGKELFTKAKYGIGDEDVYNFDEADLMMGKITTQLVMTNVERRGILKAVEPSNREWVTLIAVINAAG
ncbi:hypothetical protein KJE20_13984 [Pyrenophora tritici-repentis]|nr:hypothetical protein KJE20_13984 [Pyrenophora tritici-repentis]